MFRIWYSPSLYSPLFEVHTSPSLTSRHRVNFLTFPNSQTIPRGQLFQRTPLISFHSPSPLFSPLPHSRFQPPPVYYTPFLDVSKVSQTRNIHNHKLITFSINLLFLFYSLLQCTATSQTRQSPKPRSRDETRGSFLPEIPSLSSVTKFYWCHFFTVSKVIPCLSPPCHSLTSDTHLHAVSVMSLSQNTPVISRFLQMKVRRPLHRSRPFREGWTHALSFNLVSRHWPFTLQRTFSCLCASADTSPPPGNAC